MRPLKVRMQEHYRLIKKKDLQHPVSKHFTVCERGGPDNFTFVGVERIIKNERGGNIINTLDSRESFWIFTLKTRVSDGINVDWSLSHFLRWF
ncbi:hypothetical protein FKM82_030179 [Ascaphus truei]